jgi:ATP/maltotriose-dependent transcriptional regulator MalT
MMLETIREYALEQLGHGPGATIMRQRHAAYYLGLAEMADPQLQGAGQRAWMARLEPENDNLQAALQWALLQGAAELAGRLSAALWRFWAIRSQLGEGRHWLEAALNMQPAPAPEIRVAVLYRAGLLAFFHGDQARARALCGECCTLALQLGDRSARAYALLALSGVAMQQGDYAAAAPLLGESLELFRAAGPTAGLTWALDWMGDLARIQADHPRAAACYQESLALRRPAGDQEGIGWSCHHLGDLAGTQGDFEQALAYYHESRDQFWAIGHQEAAASTIERIGQVELLRGNLDQARAACEQSLALTQSMGLAAASAHTLHWLGNVACEQGDLAGASALHARGLAINTTLKSHEYYIDTLRGIARLAAAQGQLVQAARLFGAVEALQSVFGMWPFPFDNRYYLPIMDLAREQLGAAWPAAFQAGQALTLEQALAQARHIRA